MLYNILFNSLFDKGKQCIPDINSDYMKGRDPKKYEAYCRGHARDCNSQPMCMEGKTIF